MTACLAVPEVGFTNDDTHICTSVANHHHIIRLVIDTIIIFILMSIEVFEKDDLGLSDSRPTLQG